MPADGIWAWPVTGPAELNEAALAPVFAEADAIDLFLLGSGTRSLACRNALRARFRELGSFRSTP